MPSLHINLSLLLTPKINSCGLFYYESACFTKRVNYISYMHLQEDNDYNREIKVFCVSAMG